MKSWKILAVSAVIIIALLVGYCFRPKEISPAKEPSKTASLPQVVFLIPDDGFEVERDYNQRVFIPIQNNGPGTARLRVRSAHFPDFPAGFVGRGTPDWEEPGTVLSIPEGEIWEAPLLVHGNVAEKDEYILKLTATHQGDLAGTNDLRIQLKKPELKLETTWVLPDKPLDKARLLRTLRIRNIGANIPALSLRFDPTGPAPSQPINLDPVLEQTTLSTGQVTEVAIHPYLYPSFEKLEGTLVLTGLNQEHPVAYLAEVPEGKEVFVTLSRTSSRTSNSGTRCTNMPGSSYQMPPTSGTPSSSGWGGGGSTSGGGLGGGSLDVKDSNPSPVDSPEEDGEDEKDDGGWTLFGPIEGNTGDDEEDKKTEEDEEGKKETDQEKKKKVKDPDTGTFDLLDANTEGVVDSSVGPSGSGTSLRDTKILPGEKVTDDPGLTSPAARIEPGELEASDAKRDRKESSTYADQEGKRTHLTRRSRADGLEFLNFGWGIDGKGRKLNGYFGKAPVGTPFLGPNPRANAPAIATIVEAGEEEKEKTVIRTLDPETGQSTLLSDPAKKADSPVSLRTDNGVETLFREDGKVKRVTLGEDLKPTESKTWPAGQETGPLLDVETLAEGKLALLTKEGDGLTLRTEAEALPLDASVGSMAAAGGRLFVATLSSDGRVQVADPKDPSHTFATGGGGYGPPVLAKTANGGLRAFYHKPIPETAPEGGKGAELGGNFSVDFKDGKWGKPKRVYMPDAPVTDAAVAVEFTPVFDNAHYKDMNTGISLNGRKLRTLEKQVPFGRYLFKVPTSALGYRSHASMDSEASNRVVIDSEGIGPGNFLISDQCQVYGLHDWTQGCYVATSNDEADRLAQLSSPQLRHDAHDIVLATNGAQLPRDLKPGETREFTFAAFNAGDQASPATRVSIFYETVKIGGGELGSLEAFRGAPVSVSFTVPRTWQSGDNLSLIASVPSEGDADPSTNRLKLDLLREYQPAIAGPTSPVAVVPKALPESRVTPVPASEAKQPAEYSLNGREWFRCVIPPEGDLQVSVSGPEASLVDRIDLFDAKGRALRPQSGTWQTQGSELYVRVGLPPNTTLSSDTKIALWWE